MRKCFFSLLVLSCVLAATPAHAQGAYTGTITAGSTKFFSFTPSNSGQFTATLSWDNPQANLFVLVVCGTSSQVTYGVAAGGLDRLARMEAGLVGLNPCVIGVSGTNASPSAAFHLALHSSTGQLATPQTATLKGVFPASDGVIDARLIEHADRTIAALRDVSPR